MDIAAVSMALSQVNLSSQVGIAVLDKAMETGEDLGNGLVQMIDSAEMERSVNPNLGGNFDVRI